MPISVTDSGADILVDDGAQPIYVPKRIARVSNIGDTVRIQWSPTEYMQAVYTAYTAPAGASAVAVRDAIEAFLDTGGAVTLAANSGVDIGDVDILSIAAGENHLGAIGGNTSIIDITFAGNGAAYSTGDVIGSTQTITNAMRVNNGTGVLQSIRLLDEDDVGIAIDVVLMQNTQSLGTDNDVVSISDANARDILGHVNVVTGDYTNLLASQLATVRNIDLGVQSAAASRNLFAGLIARGAGTFTAGGGVRLRMTFLQD